MKIGDQLKKARLDKNLTQEEVAEKIFVSRQSISNWENNKTYPDIGNVIALSDLYQISLDELLKGSDNFMEHLEESTNLVKSNKKLMTLIVVALIVMIVMAIFTKFLPEKVFLVGGIILQYNIYQMTQIDAKARGLKHPKLLGVLNISGNNGNAFLLAYLIGRKKYPIQNISKKDLQTLESYKKKSLLALWINLGAALVFLIAFVYYKQMTF